MRSVWGCCCCSSCHHRPHLCPGSFASSQPLSPQGWCAWTWWAWSSTPRWWPSQGRGPGSCDDWPAWRHTYRVGHRRRAMISPAEAWRCCVPLRNGDCTPTSQSRPRCAISSTSNSLRWQLRATENRESARFMLPGLRPPERLLKQGLLGLRGPYNDSPTLLSPTWDRLRRRPREPHSCELMVDLASSSGLYPRTE